MEKKLIVHEPEFPHIYIAGDNRGSTPKLLDTIKHGLETMSVPYTEKGLIPTPVLNHFVVNEKLNKTATLDAYVEKLANAYQEFMSLSTTVSRKYDRHLIVDCANGVGTFVMERLRLAMTDHINVHLINTDVNDPTKLNHYCGAEYVNQK